MCQNTFGFSTSCVCADTCVAVLPVSPASFSKPDDATLVNISLNLPLSPSEEQEKYDDANEDACEEAHEQQQQSQQEINDRILRALAAHLDLLTAGSLFLLPSVLPYLASALTSYTSGSSSSFAPSSESLSANTASANYESACNWETAWILLLPCVGVLIPLSAFKFMGLLEESRRFQRWRQGGSYNNLYRRHCTARYVGGATCCAYHREETTAAARIAWVMPSPTVSAIKKIWRALKGDPPGYGPLALDTSVGSNARSLHFAASGPPSPTFSESDSEQEDEEVEGVHCTCDDTQSGVSERQFSVLPRPKTILMTSLGFWTVLMALSSVFGLNTITDTKSAIPTTTTTTPPPTMVAESPAQFNSNDVQPQWIHTIRQGGFMILEDDKTDDKADHEREFMSALKSLLDPEDPIGSFFEGDNKDLNEAVWVAADDDIWAHELVEGEDPFATIKAEILILNKRDQQQHDVIEEEGAAIVPEDVSEQDIEEFLRPDSLDAMTVDPEDAHIFLDFLAQLEAEDEVIKAAEKTRKQEQRQRQQKVIIAADDLVVSSMIDNDLPCGYRPGNMLRFTPDWILGAPQMVQKMMDQVTPDHLAVVHERGQVFNYQAGWTDMMILAATMCLGGLLVGLSQAKSLYHQLLEHHQARQQPCAKEDRTRNVAGGLASMVTLALCLLMAGFALGLTLLMVFAECWDVPSIYFVGIGIAGMILVHSWIPNMALQIDFTDSRSDYDCGEGEEEEGDEEKAVGDRSAVAAAMTERRNACSLDEGRRWEVASRSLEVSCFTL